MRCSPMTPPATDPLARPMRTSSGTSSVAAPVRRRLEHLQRDAQGRGGVVGIRHRGSRNGHVGVADRLDLLHARAGQQSIEPAEELVERGDDAPRIGDPRPRREPGQVGEQDGGLGVDVGDPLLAPLQPPSDRRRDGVREERLRSSLRSPAAAVAVEEQREHDRQWVRSRLTSEPMTRATYGQVALAVVEHAARARGRSRQHPERPRTSERPSPGRAPGVRRQGRGIPRSARSLPG